jgi:hypothetical protein
MGLLPLLDGNALSPKGKYLDRFNSLDYLLLKKGYPGVHCAQGFKFNSQLRVVEALLPKPLSYLCLLEGAMEGVSLPSLETSTHDTGHTSSTPGSSSCHLFLPIIFRTQMLLFDSDYQHPRLMDA